MKEETKNIIGLSLDLLRKTLIDEGVSMGMNGKDKKLIFFDTDVYLKDGKFDGFSVDINDLVK